MLEVDFYLSLGRVYTNTKLLMTTYCLRLLILLFLQALKVVASEVMVGDTCIPSLIVINNTINQLETNIF